MPRSAEVRDLALKMQIIEAIYGADKTRNIIEMIRPKGTAQAYSRYKRGAGMNPKAASQLADILKIELHVLRGELPLFIKAIMQSQSLLGRIQKYPTEEKDLKEKYESYRGVYFCWMNWVNPDNYQKPIIGLLIKIEEIDLINMVITTKLTTPTHLLKYPDYRPNSPYEWGWRGFMLPSPDTGNLFCVFGNRHRITTRHGYISLYLKRHNNGNNENIELLGIYLTEPVKGYQPTASRIFMRRIKETEEEAQLKKMGYFSKEEIAEEFDARLIENTINEQGLLTANSDFSISEARESPL